jgi:hypothetical protein
MKAKLYTFILTLLTGTALQLNAQCTVTISSLTISGSTVNATSVSTGNAVVPVSGWDWGDATTPSVGASATHTYASSGTYSVCAYFFDLTDTAGCQAQACSTITITAVGVNENAQLATTLSAFPSPFVNNANISYTLAQNNNVEIEVYDITGKLVTKFENVPQTAGNHTIVWEATDVNAGVYFVRLKSGDATITRRIVKQ